jgi:hypothetical protein
MSEPYETDEISRVLDTIFAGYFGPPTEMDLRGVDPATFALGLSFGFDTWQHVRVVANNRRNVGTAARYWAERHPTPEYLSHAVGTDERAAGHRLLLDRAHPSCARCEEHLQRLTAGDLDHVDPNALPDDIDIEAWLLFRPVDAVRRSGTEAPDATRSLHIRGRADDQSITADHDAGRDWRITVRDPRARRATLWIGWTGGQTTEHTVVFENDLAETYAEAPDDQARPVRVRVRVTDPPDPQ